MSTISFIVSMLQSGTTEQNSLCDISGNLTAFTISSPSIRLFASPSGNIPCLLHSFVDQRSTALNNSTSFTVNTSFVTSDSSTDRSTVTKSSDVTAFSVCVSITFQHRSSRSVSSNLLAYGRMQNTFDTSKMSRRYSVHFSASDGTMYFFAKYRTCITLFPVKFTLSVYK